MQEAKGIWTSASTQKGKEKRTEEEMGLDRFRGLWPRSCRRTFAVKASSCSNLEIIPKVKLTENSWDFI